MKTYQKQTFKTIIVDYKQSSIAPIMMETTKAYLDTQDKEQVVFKLS